MHADLMIMLCMQSLTVRAAEIGVRAYPVITSSCRFGHLTLGLVATMF